MYRLITIMFFLFLPAAAILANTAPGKMTTLKPTFHTIALTDTIPALQKQTQTQSQTQTQAREQLHKGQSDVPGSNGHFQKGKPDHAGNPDIKQVPKVKHKAKPGSIKPGVKPKIVRPGNMGRGLGKK